MLTRRGPRDERGATLIIFALFLVAALIIVAIVIDYGTVRADRQDNKRAADVAVTAAIEKMRDINDGVPRPWRAICEAINYLEANNGQMAGLGASGTYKDGAGTAIGSNPCSNQAVAPYTSSCTANTPTTWGWFTGTVNGGAIQVDIKSGYQMPDPEWDSASDTDVGKLGGCDNVAVIINETEKTTFGQVAGGSTHSSRIRSVGRVVVRNDNDAVVALLLLEQEACDVLSVGGNSSAKVVAGGYQDRPGIMHSDSLGKTGANSCNNRKVFNVNANNPSQPYIVAENSVDNQFDGLITSRSLSGELGAVAGNTNSPCPTHVLAQPNKCVTAGGLLTRRRVDERYRTSAIALRADADTKTNWTTAAAQTNGYRVTGCNPTSDDLGITTSTPKLFVDCPNYTSGNGAVVFNNTDIVFNGALTASGGGNSSLTFTNPRSIIVKGTTSGSAVTYGGPFNINTNGQGNCTARQTQNRAETTKFIVMSGLLSSSGGFARWCGTTLFLMDDIGGADGCPIPSVDGVAPYDNDCTGKIDLSGQSGIEWSGPNQTSTTPTAAELQNFEDLALWTETAGQTAGTMGVAGNGGVTLRGIFFTPNADPFVLGGNGNYNVTDAQFLTRRLRANGNAVLTLRPNPNDSISFPVFESGGLVR